MISSVLTLAMAAYMQPTDTTRASREAFTACLRTYVDQSANAHMAAAEFTTAYPQQCSAQQQAYRESVIRREIASRSSRADAEESANMEIEDQRTNFRERFEMALAPPRSSRSAPAQQAAAPAPAAAPAATATASAAPATASAAPATASAAPAAAPASQPTLPAQPASSPH